MEKIAAPQGVFENGTFFFPARVYYEDTDAGGIVYYANYLKYAERARTEFIRALGFCQQENLLAEDSFGFAVRRCEVDYLKPAVLDDLLKISARVEKIGGASMDIQQEIYRGEELLTIIKVTVVYLSFAKKRPVKIPADLVEKIMLK